MDANIPPTDQESTRHDIRHQGSRPKNSPPTANDRDFDEAPPAQETPEERLAARELRKKKRLDRQANPAYQAMKAKQKEVRKQLYQTQKAKNKELTKERKTAERDAKRTERRAKDQALASVLKTGADPKAPLKLVYTRPTRVPSEPDA